MEDNFNYLRFIVFQKNLKWNLTMVLLPCLFAECQLKTILPTRHLTNYRYRKDGTKRRPDPHHLSAESERIKIAHKIVANAHQRRYKDWFQKNSKESYHG